MAKQSKCWWKCNTCDHTVWRGIVTGSDKPCPKCGSGHVVPAGGYNFRQAVEFFTRRKQDTPS